MHAWAEFRRHEVSKGFEPAVGHKMVVDVAGATISSGCIQTYDCRSDAPRAPISSLMELTSIIIVMNIISIHSYSSTFILSIYQQNFCVLYFLCLEYLITSSPSLLCEQDHSNTRQRASGKLQRITGIKPR